MQKATKNLYQLIDENQAWQTLDAIKYDRLYVMDRKLFNIKPNSKWAESYEKVIEILLKEK